MTRVAIMQPYLFPYIGYYQLVFAADKFVFFDDVNFRKKSYIQRNSILLDGEPCLFTLPVIAASQNKKIRDLEFSIEVGSVLNKIRESYLNAPYFNQIFPMVEHVLGSKSRCLADVCEMSIREVFGLAGLSVEILRSSDLDYDREADAQGKILDIVKSLRGDLYLNPPGGRGLYSRGEFRENGIELYFLESVQTPYQQANLTGFVENLSVIDVLMWAGTEGLRERLDSHRLVE